MSVPEGTDLVFEAGALRWTATIAGQGPELVLLHGTGATRHSWDAILPLLSAHFRVVALDLPGHGDTGYPGFEQLTCDAMASLVRHAISALSLHPRGIVGHSAGAAIMLQMAAVHALTHDVRLVGINAALEPPPEIARALMRGPVGDIFRSGVARSVVRTVARVSPMIELLLSTTGSRLTPAQEGDYVTAFSNGHHAEAAYAMVANWDLVPLRRALTGISQETLFIVGRDDPWVPARVSRDAARQMSRARVGEIAGGGHLVHEERPTDVAALLLDFLSEPETGTKRQQ